MAKRIGGQVKVPSVGIIATLAMSKRTHKTAAPAETIRTEKARSVMGDVL
jgi:hypothetical protein